MVKTVVESIPVYWLSLFKVPKSILHSLRRLAASYLWSGSDGDNKFHLANWGMITRPKPLGGWGLCDLALFSQALHMKCLWRGFISDTLWSRIILEKYLHGTLITKWLQSNDMLRVTSSPVWRGLMEVFHYIRREIAR